MSKYDIKKTPQIPSDEEINKHKNFDKVLKKAAMYDYKKATTPIYKNVKVLSIVAVLVAVGLILLFETHDQEDGVKDTIEKKDSLQKNNSVPVKDTTVQPTATTPVSPNPVAPASPAPTQTATPNQPSTPEVSEAATPAAEIAKNTADFPGGDNALHTFLLANIKYPYNAIETPYTGKIEVDLKIEKTGDIGNVTIYHSPNAAISNEIQRVIKKMPKWNAAVINNEAVASTVTVYFPFTYIEH